MKSESYEEFVEKFKPKRTTDDCFTPPLVYETVKDWVCSEYGVKETDIVRPFWPGMDYQTQTYPGNCIVVDNPPFSILSKICEWYLDRGIKFFLFAPSLTALSSKKVCLKMNHVICDADIVYENGAVVRTSFVTNLGDSEIVLQSAPSLSDSINKAIQKIKSGNTKTLPKYEYPNHIVTAAIVQRYSKYGIDFCVKKDECMRISQLDAQREKRKGIFGGGLLLSTAAANRRAAAERAAAERAAAERAAAERANALVWKLSEKERKIVKKIDKGVLE